MKTDDAARPLKAVILAAGDRSIAEDGQSLLLETLGGTPYPLYFSLT